VTGRLASGQVVRSEPSGRPERARDKLFGDCVVRQNLRRHSSDITQRWARRLGLTNDPTRVLAHADALAAGGGPDRAVDLLTHANARRRDPRIEQRLLEIRFEGFAAAPRPADPPPWPSVVPDVFPGRHIPEVRRADLTADRLRSAITHHGSLIVRGFATPAEVTKSVTNIDRAFAAYDAMSAGRSAATSLDDARPELTGWFLPFKYDRVSNRELKREAGSMLAVDSPPAMNGLLETFEAANVGALTREYFGERPALLARKWSLRRVAHDARTGDWHQDGAFMGADIRSLNIWLGLTHCGDSAPGLDVVARRIDHIVETGTGGAFFTWSVGGLIAEKVAEGSIERPIFEPGDALLFDHFCLHRTAIDAGMHVDRHAIEAWFLAPSTYGAMLGPGGNDDAPQDQIPMLY
jgi:hypothetical protein